MANAPSDTAAVISYDEKPGMQAIGSTAPDLPTKPGVHAACYESKTIGRQQSGMQFSPPEPRNDPERSFAGGHGFCRRGGRSVSLGRAGCGGVIQPVRGRCTGPRCSSAAWPSS